MPEPIVSRIVGPAGLAGVLNDIINPSIKRAMQQQVQHHIVVSSHSTNMTASSGVIMSDLDSWFKAREGESFFENLSATGLQTMKDYLYGNITTADAAIKYTANQHPDPAGEKYV